MPFLSSPGPHEDLHSFPTRRSSDLNAGLDPNTVLQSISVGADGSWSMSNYGPRMIQRDFAPGFAIKHYIKDMNIALESAEELNISTPGLKLALQMYEQLAAKGENESGIHALIKYFEE